MLKRESVPLLETSKRRLKLALDAAGAYLWFVIILFDALLLGYLTDTIFDQRLQIFSIPN